MNPHVHQAVLGAASRRAHRASVAKALEARAPRQAASLDWQALEQAPPWLALDPTSLLVLQRRVGSVLLAPALRLWISAAKVSAARSALGDLWWLRLLGHRTWPDWSGELAQWGDWPEPDSASSGGEAVAAVLDEAGAAVLLATVPHGALRHAASQALATLASAAQTVATTIDAAHTFDPAVLPPTKAQAVLALTLQLLRDEAVEAANAPSANSNGEPEPTKPTKPTEPTEPTASTAPTASAKDAP